VGTLIAFTLSGWTIGEWLFAAFFVLFGGFLAFLLYPRMVEDRTGRFEKQGSYTWAVIAFVLLAAFGVAGAATGASSDQASRHKAEAEQARVSQARQDLGWAQERGFEIVELDVTDNNEGHVVFSRSNCATGIGLKLFDGKYQLYVSRGNRPVSPEIFEALFVDTCPYEKP
jgi:hypothetical protein